MWRELSIYATIEKVIMWRELSIHAAIEKVIIIMYALLLIKISNRRPKKKSIGIVKFPNFKK